MIYEKYVKCVEKELEKNINEMTFKSLPDYKYMLEHVSPTQGYQYLQYIINDYSKIYNDNKKYIIDICYLNDKYGVPDKFDFKNFIFTSPTNIRYIYQSFKILNYMKKINTNNIDIIEIGGGYGGLCFFIHNFSKLFNINIASYTIFDLPIITKLQKIYTSSLNINIIVFDITNTFNVSNNSFLISNYAFSEIDINIQKIYKDKLFKFIDHGFLCWNNIPLYSFINDKKIESEREYPLTGEKNLYVYF